MTNTEKALQVKDCFCQIKTSFAFLIADKLGIEPVEAFVRVLDL